MEDYLNFLKIEENLIILKVEDPLINLVVIIVNIPDLSLEGFYLTMTETLGKNQT